MPASLLLEDPLKTVMQRNPRAVIAVFPAKNILTVSFIFNGRFGNLITLSVFDE